MRGLAGSALALAAVVSTVALVTSAAGAGRAGGTKSIRPHGVVATLALSGSRVAFANGPKIFVWDLGTGRTTTLSAEKDSGTTTLAIAGSRVVWLNRTGGNLEGDDYLYTASLQKPTPRLVAQEVRSGAPCGAGRGGWQPACAGTWLGGVVGSGNRILVNRWTTAGTGAITRAGLYALEGRAFKPVASGTTAVQAVAADAKSVVVLQWRWHPPGNTVHVYSSGGKLLSTVKPKAQLGVAISGRNLVVLQEDGHLARYDAGTGALRRAFDLHAKELPKNERPYSNPRWLQALAVEGNVAVYSKPVRYVRGGVPRESTIHAFNLLTGKDRVIGRSAGQIPLAQMGPIGLVYATEGEGYAPSRVVFVPLRQVVAAVS